jgi:hypothetical protein
LPETVRSIIIDLKNQADKHDDVNSSSNSYGSSQITGKTDPAMMSFHTENLFYLCIYVCGRDPQLRFRQIKAFFRNAIGFRHNSHTTIMEEKKWHPTKPLPIQSPRQ